MNVVDFEQVVNRLKQLGYVASEEDMEAIDFETQKTLDYVKNLSDKKETTQPKQNSVKQNGDKYQDFVNNLIKSREEN